MKEIVFEPRQQVPGSLHDPQRVNIYRRIGTKWVEERYTILKTLSLTNSKPVQDDTFQKLLPI
jgi:hypothetical protein